MHLNKKLKNLALISAIMTAGLFSQPVSAQTLQHIYVFPGNWRLQNYNREDEIAVWGTGAPDCGGSTGMQLIAGPDRLNRFWAMILTAKSTNKKVGIYYYVVAPGSCMIDSFYIQD